MTIKRKIIRSGLCVLSCIIALAVYTLPASASSLSTTTLITTGMDGKGANNSSFQRTKTLSHDGHVMVFASDASNIVPNDTNNETDVFAYDRMTKKTELISATPAGVPGDNRSAGPTISADGRYVAYTTGASDILVRNPDMCTHHYCQNIIVHDRHTGKNIFGNLDNDGKPLYIDNEYWNTISADGKSVVFNTNSVRPGDTNDKVDTYIRNVQTGVTKLVTVDNAGKVGSEAAYGFSASANGQYVVFDTYSKMTQDDKNDAYDVFVRDTFANKTSLVSVRLNDPESRYGAFDGVISDDGKSVVFLSDGSNFVKNDTNNKRDVFVRNLQNNTTKRISMAYNGEQGNEYAGEASISSDGRFVVYPSYASNMVAGDTNNRQDIFLYDSTVGLTRRINRASADGKPTTTGQSDRPVISGNGRAVMFISSDQNLTSTVLDPSWPENVYLVYNPVVETPFYDPYDVVELLKSF